MHYGHLPGPHSAVPRPHQRGAGQRLQDRGELAAPQEGEEGGVPCLSAGGGPVGRGQDPGAAVRGREAPGGAAVLRWGGLGGTAPLH